MLYLDKSSEQPVVMLLTKPVKVSFEQPAPLHSIAKSWSMGAINEALGLA
jgi:hypothetical protein